MRTPSPSAGCGPAQVGGKSLIWGRVALRWSEIDFEANKRDGHGSPWPISYDEIAPWYSYVEKYAGIAGSKEGLPQLPDGEFQPPHPMNVAELWVKERLEKAIPGRKLISTRTANMTEDKPEQGRTRCQEPQHVRAGLFVRRLFLHASRDPAGGAQDRQPDLAVGPGGDQPGI